MKLATGHAIKESMMLLNSEVLPVVIGPVRCELEVPVFLQLGQNVRVFGLKFKFWQRLISLT